MSKSSAVVGYGPDDWEAKRDMRTLVDAQCIKNDPKRYAKAKKCAEQEAEEIEQAFDTEPAEDGAGKKDKGDPY